MAALPARKVLGTINPNAIIILTSETLVETTIDPSSPFKSFKSMTLASTTKNQDLIAPKPATANAHFLTVPQYKARPRSKPKSKSKSKSKADFRPVPRSIQLEAAIDDGELDIIGQEVDEGITIPVSIEMEPKTAPSLVPLSIESTQSPRSIITSPTPSNQRPKSAESVPPAKLEAERPTPKQSTLLNEAMGRIPEFHVAPDGFQAPKVSLRKMIRAAKIRKLESRKARVPTVTPADYGIDAETVAEVLDSVVKKRLEGVGSRLEGAVRYGKEYNQEQGHSSHGTGVLLPPNTLYPLDYAIDTTRVWVDSMEYGYGDEGAKVKGSISAATAPECKEIELVKVAGVKVGVSKGSPEVTLENKAGARVKGVRFATTADVKMYDPRRILPKFDDRLRVDVGLKVTGDKIEDLAAFLNGVSDEVAGPRMGVERVIMRPRRCLLDVFEGRQ